MSAAQGTTSIESIANENGNTYWWAHELYDWLTYASFDSFKNVIRKAKSSTEKLGIDVETEFCYDETKDRKTWKLSRFAVLLCVVHADSKKEKVSLAKAALAGVASQALQAYQLECLEKREELFEKDKFMTTTAVQHGLPISDIGIFKDSGYRGMYNMRLAQLKQHKGVDTKATLYDYMGLLEMSANSFRSALTAESIKSKNLSSRKGLIDEAHSIGQKVRAIVTTETEKTPESLPIDTKISDVKKELKQVRKKMIKDTPNKKE